MPDMLMQEKYGTEFVDDARIFESGIITKNCMASTTPDESREYESRVIAAKASINGAWFNWYGRFGGSGNMPAYRNIFEIPPRLKLIRMVPNWENLSGIPLSERHWDGEVYSSPNAYVSKDIICSRQPKTGKIFVVFLTNEGVVKLPSGKTVKNIYHTDDFFMESGDAIPDVTISSGTVRLNGNSGIEKGYIIILSE